MLLKLKAKIYQYTGIYLAQAEEDAYIKNLDIGNSNMDAYREMAKNYSLTMDAERLIELKERTEAADWQIDNGFRTLMTKTSTSKIFARIRKQRLKYAYYASYDFVARFILQLKWDITSLLSKD